ncbi:hypothetical protein HUT06_13070 [Actinomadura sp. NAK00032]|uniref:hypothetical protein n=1 Tax=Actinomadura sp. NAK00032 TaxID=2742128 RepID=UPI0015909300|nr:hypothetical protein [Actinomadura sp. NAK00032]QKW34844.1 hypothetical protein HUT06_13070 [Actinomadura sp. NAK00032]
MTVGAGAQPGAGPAAAPAGGLGRGARTWHRFHYAVGVFLLAYGVAVLASGVLLWGDRVDEAEGYFGSGPASGVLVAVKAAEGLLLLCAAAGVALRRDTLFVPPLAGWMAGFAMFAVLDVFTGRWGGLIQHLLYLAAFVVLLFLSYGLSAKAQLAGMRATAEPGSSSPAGPRGLTRTQEFALQAIDRAVALTGPRQRPVPPPAPAAPSPQPQPPSPQSPPAGQSD